MPEKLKRILQNKNWRSWKKSDWLLLALAGILLLVIALPVESQMTYGHTHLCNY